MTDTPGPSSAPVGFASALGVAVRGVYPESRDTPPIEPVLPGGVAAGRCTAALVVALVLDTPAEQPSAYEGAAYQDQRLVVSCPVATARRDKPAGVGMRVCLSAEGGPKSAAFITVDASTAYFFLGL